MIETEQPAGLNRLPCEEELYRERNLIAALAAAAVAVLALPALAGNIIDE